MLKPAQMLMLCMMLPGCLGVTAPAPAPAPGLAAPDPGYCDALDLQLDSIYPAMAASARADMERAGCPHIRAPHRPA